MSPSQEQRRAKNRPPKRSRCNLTQHRPNTKAPNCEAARIALWYYLLFIARSLDSGEENLLCHREVLTLESMDNFYYGKIKKEGFLCVLFVLYKVTLTFCTRRLNLWLSQWNFKTVTDESELWILEPASHANICNFLSFEATGLPYLNERPKITQDVRKLSKTIYIVIEATILAMHGKKIVKFGRFTQGDDHYWKIKIKIHIWSNPWVATEGALLQEHSMTSPATAVSVTGPCCWRQCNEKANQTTWE